MSETKPLNFFLIGRSGCGKGTQAKLLMEKFSNLAYISTGDFMRELASKDTDAGMRIKAILDKGGLPFDDIATTLWMREIAYRVKVDQGIMGDGFPRRLNEAQNLDRFLNWLERKESRRILLVDIGRAEAFKRLKARGRGDDSDTEINNRLDFYEERVVPVIDHYREQKCLIEINGEQSVAKVFEEILAKI